MNNKNTCLVLAGLLSCGGTVYAACNTSMSLTRNDNRYEAVTNASPIGSEVRDKVTGLVWQRCVIGKVWNGSSCLGAANSLTWIQALDAARTATISQAPAASAWRLPSYAELNSLIERSCYGPSININWFPATPEDSMWTSSPSVRDPNQAWTFNFGVGYAHSFSKTEAYHVRLVR